MSEVQQLFEVTPKQQLATYAVTRVASDPTVVAELERLNGLLIQAARVPAEIPDQGTYAKAGDLLKLIKASRKKLDEYRKGLTGPVDRALKAVNKYFREAAFTEIDEAESEIKAKMGDWYRAEEQKRQEAARLAAQEAERQALEAAQALEASGQEAAAEAVVEQAIETSEAEAKAAKLGPTRGDHGSTTSARKVWKWRVADKTQVPMEYLTVDKLLVNQAVKAGVREIPGLEIYEDVQVAIR
jgi:hypothetical protein